jgi:hypothetical protein
MVSQADRIDDRFGTDLPDLHIATQHAVRIARELEADAFGPDWLIVIADEGGAELIEVTPNGEIRSISPPTPR